jgi:threonine dehydrogenase-like Zn-dependent dehydrogenase
MMIFKGARIHSRVQESNRPNRIAIVGAGAVGLAVVRILEAILRDERHSNTWPSC